MNRIANFLSIVLASVMMLAVGACSTEKQLSAAALPLAQQMQGDYAIYVANLPEGEEKVAKAALGQQFVAATSSGVKTAIVPLWYGPPDSFRQTYVGFLDTDPKLSTETGVRVKNILKRNVTAFDWILTIGDKPPAK